MQLNKYEQEKKYALALMRERNEIFKQQRRISSIKLDVPIQHGFVRSLILRNEIKNRSDYDKIKEVINFFGCNKVYHKNENFITPNHKGYVEQHAYIKTITDPRFQFYYTESKRQLDLEKIKTYNKYLLLHSSVYTCSCIHCNNKTKNSFRPHYNFKFPWMLNEVTKPYYLTHYTPIDGVLESRLQEINSILYKNNFYIKYFEYRNSFDKLDKQIWLSTKYDDHKSLKYHSIEE